MKTALLLLFMLHLGLGAWGLGGLAEYLLPGLGFGLQNPLFPAWLQLAHWLAILAGATAFLLGYLALARLLLPMLAAAYLAMAAVCAVETLFFLDGSGRYLAMAAEYAAYLAILALLAHRERRRVSSLRTARAPARPAS
ncbi:MAG: hypothetical protein WDZ84_10865 [Rhodovibrionaceae bacterium]